MEHPHYTKIQAGRPFESVQRPNSVGGEFDVCRGRSRLDCAVSFDGQNRA